MQTIMKRQKLLQEVSEILGCDLTKLVATESGLFVTSIPVETIRELFLPKEIPNKKCRDKIAQLFCWMYEDIKLAAEI